MSSKFFKPINKMMGAIGLIDEEDQELINDADEETIEDGAFMEPEIIPSKKNKVVSIKTNSSPKVLLKKPVEFQDIMEIVDSVKARRIVVMNIVEVEQKLAQRMIDYIVGACYALNAAFEEIDKSIYIMAPDNVEITNELKNQISTTGFFSF